MLALGLENIPLIKEGDDLAAVILRALREKNVALEDGDVVVVTEKVVAKAEGRLVSLSSVVPSEKALQLARITGKDPRIVELILQESREILRVGRNFIVVETKQGFVCANAGIDQSNVAPGKAKLLPANPDKSASRIRKSLEKATGKKLGVLVVDSFGRPFRRGSIGVALGASGVTALWDRRGEKDLYGRRLEVTRVSVADCLASAAALLLGDAREKIPVVVIRGLNFLGEGKAAELLRPRDEDVFR
jgi:coenzyme F420-0:L-glutamate ligase/coenzyme F420-1:gamma-L-glutamate ligase